MATMAEQTETIRLRRRVEELEHEVEALQTELARQEAGTRRQPRVDVAPRHRGLRLRPEALLLAAGGILILLGVALLLALAIARGWLTPAMQVALAESIGALIAGTGFVLLRRWDLRERLRLSPPLVGAIVGIGAGTAMLGLVASALAYDTPVLPTWSALALTAIAAAAVCLAAVQTGSQWLASLGLGAALLGPLALDIGASYASLAFIGTALLATSILAATRSWPWIGVMALVTTSPQLIMYIQDRLGPAVDPAIQTRSWALLALALIWWLLIAYASVGCAMVRPLQRTSLPLSLGFTLPAAGFAAVVVLGFAGDGDGFNAGDIAVPALLILAIVHAMLMIVFALQADRASANGALLAAALLTAVALPIESDPPALIVFWAALAVAVVAAGRRQGDAVVTGGGLVLAGVAWIVAIAPHGPEFLLFGAGDIVSFTVECAALVAMLAAVARVLRDSPRARIAWIAGGVTAVYWGSALFVTALTPEAIRLAQGPTPDQTAQAALSIAWGLSGLALIGLAVRRRSAALRIAGIAVLGATAVKVVLLDTNTLAAGVRVSALLVSGVVLVVGAWLLWHLAAADHGESAERSTPAAPVR